MTKKISLETFDVTITDENGQAETATCYDVSKLTSEEFEAFMDAQMAIARENKRAR